MHSNVVIEGWAGGVERKGQLNVGPIEIYGEMYVVDHREDPDRNQGGMWLEH